MAERVLIVTNDGKDADYAITNQVKEYLTQEGKICLQCPKDENNAIVSEQIPPDLDYAIVIGVDGRFLLRVAVLCVAEMSRFWESIWEH